jgi:hypothetical protein
MHCKLWCTHLRLRVHTVSLHSTAGIILSLQAAVCVILCVVATLDATISVFEVEVYSACSNVLKAHRKYVDLCAHRLSYRLSRASLQ